MKDYEAIAELQKRVNENVGQYLNSHSSPSAEGFDAMAGIFMDEVIRLYYELKQRDELSVSTPDRE